MAKNAFLKFVLHQSTPFNQECEYSFHHHEKQLNVRYFPLYDVAFRHW